MDPDDDATVLEAVDDEPEAVAEELRSRADIVALRIVRPVDHQAVCVLSAMLGGACSQIRRLELDVDLSQDADRLITNLEAIIARSSSIRRLVLLFDPRPIPLRLISMSLSSSSIDHLTIGSRNERVFDVEAQAIGDLLRITAPFRTTDRHLVLVRPYQSQCSPAGYVRTLEPWTDAVIRTLKVTALMHRTHLQIAREGPDGRAFTSLDGVETCSAVLIESDHTVSSNAVLARISAPICVYRPGARRLRPPARIVAYEGRLNRAPISMPRR